MNTIAVWISAIAADSSELEVSQELTIAGAITLEFGPIRKTETPEFAHRGDEDQQPCRDQPRAQQRQGDGAHLIAPAAPQTRAHSSRLWSICSTTPAMVRRPSGSNTVK